jgi:cysteine desulfurase/selenocysteine lyase
MIMSARLQASLQDSAATQVADLAACRDDFPVLQQRVNGKPLIYLDSAATTQKPQSVIDAVTGFYREYNSNVHRGVHSLSVRATEVYEQVRHKVARLIHAQSDEEIVFVRGATEAINLVACSFVLPKLQVGDEVLVSAMEHHSNIVPWQLACNQAGARLRVVPMNDAGELEMGAFRQLLGPRTRLLAVAHISNALGTVNPVSEMIELAHQQGIPVLVDGAQAVLHQKVDVQALDCDFYCFSSHKMLGPTGVGVLYGKAELLAAMPPYQGGGDMIRSVTFERTTYNTPPHRFEAGTPNIAGCVGLGAAIDYLTRIGLDRISTYEQTLLTQAHQALAKIDGVRIVGTAAHKAAVVSFVLDGAHPHDVGTVLDQDGIAIRTGHHCAQPVMDRFGIAATARASFALYNTAREVETLAEKLAQVRGIFA